MDAEYPLQVKTLWGFLQKAMFSFSKSWSQQDDDDRHYSELKQSYRDHQAARFIIGKISPIDEQFDKHGQRDAEPDIFAADEEE